ncbi:MarR family winged helix-turn-helix transcriptional regulator [Reyranella sp.]|jgi:MarR family transcriptional regulator for hemolysin|uniref:MarR family winged helix-turn-helix transcriptional regulator n=1 Tax=Reyranella sp. TaxID=1929291 RepID=UPI002F91DF2F
MSPPKDTLRITFGALLALASRQWRRAADQRLQPFKLTEATWLPLVHIARAATPPRQKDLAASLSLDSSSVVRLLDNLEAAGLIRRREEASDRRAKAIFLTARGRAIADKVEVAARQVRHDALGGLSDRDIEAAYRVLTHVCGALERSMPEIAA